MDRRRYTALTAVALGTAPAAAQPPADAPSADVRPSDPRPAAGTRVRVTTPPSDRLAGTVLAYRGDTLLLSRGAGRDETTRVALGDVRRLEVSAGTRRRLLKGTLLGLGAGGAAGALLGVVTYREATPRCTQNGREVPCLLDFQFGRDFAAAAGGVLGGAAGLLVGLVAGAQRVERWREVPHARRSARLRLVPPTGRPGAGLAVTATF